MASSDEMDSDEINQEDDQMIDQLLSSLPEAKIKEDKLALQTRQCKKGSTLAKDKDDNSSISTGLRRSSRKRATKNESPKSGSSSKPKHRKNCACHLCRKVTTDQPPAKKMKETTQADEKMATVLESITTLQQLLSKDNPRAQTPKSPYLTPSKKAAILSVGKIFSASSLPFKAASLSTSEASVNVPTQCSKPTVLKSRKSSGHNVGQPVSEIPNRTEMDSDDEEIQLIKQFPPQLTEKEIEEDKLAHQMLQLTEGSTIIEDDEDDIPAKLTGQSSSRKRMTKSNFPESSSCNKPKHPINCSCHLRQKVSKNEPQLSEDNPRAQTPESPNLKISKKAATLSDGDTFPAFLSPFEAAGPSTSAEISVNVSTQSGKPTELKLRQSSDHNVEQLVSAVPSLTEIYSDEEEIQLIKQLSPQLTVKEIEDDKLAHQMLLITKGSTLIKDVEDDIPAKSTGQNSFKKRITKSNFPESSSCNKPKHPINSTCHLRQKASEDEHLAEAMKITAELEEQLAVIRNTKAFFQNQQTPEGIARAKKWKAKLNIPESAVNLPSEEAMLSSSLFIYPTASGLVFDDHPSCGRPVELKSRRPPIQLGKLASEVPSPDDDLSEEKINQILAMFDEKPEIKKGSKLTKKNSSAKASGQRPSKVSAIEGEPSKSVSCNQPKHPQGCLCHLQQVSKKPSSATKRNKTTEQESGVQNSLIPKMVVRQSDEKTRQLKVPANPKPLVNITDDHLTGRVCPVCRLSSTKITGKTLFAITKCGHMLCYECAARLHFTSPKSSEEGIDCPTCGMPSEKIFLTESKFSFPKEVQQYSKVVWAVVAKLTPTPGFANLVHFDAFKKQDYEESLNTIMNIICTSCKFDVVGSWGPIKQNCLQFNKLFEHFRHQNRTFCKLCFLNLNALPCEMKMCPITPRSNLEKAWITRTVENDEITYPYHLRSGSEVMNGLFIEHPRCTLCFGELGPEEVPDEDHYFFDNDALYKHAQEKHVICPRCPEKTTFVDDAETLKEHLKKEH